MDQTPQQQNTEFLRRTINSLTFEEVERYAWLAGAKSLQSMAIRAQEEIESQLDEATEDARREGRQEGEDAEHEKIVEATHERLKAIKREAEDLAEDMKRHAQVITEKADEINKQLHLLEGVL